LLWHSPVTTSFPLSSSILILLAGLGIESKQKLVRNGKDPSPGESSVTGRVNLAPQPRIDIKPAHIPTRNM